MAKGAIAKALYDRLLNEMDDGVILKYGMPRGRSEALTGYLYEILERTWQGMGLDASYEIIHAGVV